MDTLDENLLFLDSLRGSLDHLRSLLNKEWRSYKFKLLVLSRQLMEAQSSVDVNVTVDSLIDELLNSPANDLVRQILRDSLGSRFAEERGSGSRNVQDTIEMLNPATLDAVRNVANTLTTSLLSI